MSISLVVNTINEEKNIKQVLSSVKGLVDEIIVVDMESDDNTQKLAKKLGAKVFTHKRTHYVEPARNFAISKASGNWILILDADEEVTTELKSKLKNIVTEDSADFVRIPRKNMIFGKWVRHARWWPDENIRFFKKGSVTWEDEIHSIPVTTGRGVTLEDKEELAIIHHHYDTIEQYLEKLNRYTTIQASELFKKKTEVHVSDFIKKPTGEFLSRYFAGEGYKDGLHGLVLSLLQAFSEVILYSKLWGLYGFKKTDISAKSISAVISEAQKDVNYWKAHSQVKEGAGISQKLKRKFKLS